MAKIKYSQSKQTETDTSSKIQVGGTTITKKQPEVTPTLIPQLVEDDSNTGSPAPEELDTAPPPPLS